jgi:hypothetical protein
MLIGHQAGSPSSRRARSRTAYEKVAGRGGEGGERREGGGGGGGGRGGRGGGGQERCDAAGLPASGTPFRLRALPWVSTEGTEVPAPGTDRIELSWDVRGTVWAGTVPRTSDDAVTTSARCTRYCTWVPARMYLRTSYSTVIDTSIPLPTIPPHQHAHHAHCSQRGPSRLLGFFVARGAC